VHTAIGKYHTGFADCLLANSQQTPDDGQKTYPKHVEFYAKNKFVKLVRPVGFIIRK